MIENESVLMVLVGCLIEFLDLDLEFIQASECSYLDFQETFIQKVIDF